MDASQLLPQSAFCAGCHLLARANARCSRCLEHGTPKSILYPRPQYSHPTQRRFKFRGRNVMKNLGRLDVIRLAAFGLLLILPATLAAQAQQRAPILDKIAKTYGLDSWDQIQAIRYTWNGEILGWFKPSHGGRGDRK